MWLSAGYRSDQDPWTVTSSSHGPRLVKLTHRYEEQEELIEPVVYCPLVNIGDTGSAGPSDWATPGSSG